MNTDNNIISNDTLTVSQLAISYPGALAVFTRYILIPAVAVIVRRLYRYNAYAIPV